MSLFRRKSPEEKEAEKRERQRQRRAEEIRRAQEVEGERRVKDARKAIEDFYVSEAPKWDYLQIIRNRMPQPGEWAGPWDTDVPLEKLGDTGWELVSITALSSAGNMCAGNHDTEKWTFKRPKPPLPERLTRALRDAEVLASPPAIEVAISVALAAEEG